MPCMTEKGDTRDTHREGLRALSASLMLLTNTEDGNDEQEPHS